PAPSVTDGVDSGRNARMTSRAARKRTGNRLLDSLPAEELDQLRRVWEVVSLGPAEEVCRENGALSHGHFPVSGIYSTIVGFDDGRIVEASTVGNEGMIGIAAVLGLGFSPKSATTPVPGSCLRLPVPALRPLLRSDTSVGRVLHRYAAF